ncbi:outer membrane lipoprotein-sorting protein [Parabacteroides sp. PH5-13]|uniref:outer membrane lipoprotein-sorting protein n=1 Tax=unclassified Parabacteroides TaxID=2649774 RepID=UPI00247615A7|nr:MULTISPECIES: outer membrane lipoprotein-sorting protein [unclassified Parabacteroides]MDH6305339.1 outer membrane lipoprotein-sorting protein [Parabacteroides sp. PH5-39]MDH6320128.1 outer membrane lipoprotein-sorting protein [Parabacteroides sp. PH5-13]MDH6323929.1 outer membrane lipoprotein-sorting protein [Parabacteroides sp. PH5-8]MDH6385041.1 outer membrane lipoprotein-sorting protein [Parabacteroides sp. PH5-17]MDH6394325.1 outer membrane lipoprotein-sorting protein [Parabacteroides 
MKTICIISLLVLLAGNMPVYAAGPDYLSLIDEALYIEYADIKMEVYKNDKLLKYYQIEFYRKEAKMRMEFVGPAVEKGRRMLNDESNMWMYMPRTSKVIKLPLKQAFMGSDASNRDLMRLAFSKDYELTGSEQQEGTLVQLELKAKDLSVSYNKVIVLFDSQRGVPLKQEMFALSGKLIKTIDYAYDKQSDGTLYMSEMLIKDELLKNSLTKMYYENCKRRQEKPSVFFTLGSLKQ